MKKALLPILVLLLLVLVGCTKEAAPATVAAPSTAPAASAVTEAAPADGSSDKAVEPKVMKFSCAMSKDQFYDVACQEWAALVEERTNGEITFDFYFLSALGGDREVQEAMMVNGVQFIVSGPAIASYNVPEWAFPDLPGMFPTRESVYLFWESDVAQEMLDMMTVGGIKGITNLEGGMYELCNNQGVEVHKLEDLANMKVRAMENNIQMSAWSSLGMQPTVMSWNDIYLSLQQKVIDAVECGVGSFYSEKFYENCKDLCLSHRTFQQTYIAMSELAWEGCTPEQQKIMLDAAEEIKWKLYDDYSALLDEYYKTLQSDYGVTITELDEGEWEKIAGICADSYKLAEQINPDLYARYMQAVEDAKTDTEAKFAKLYEEHKYY